MCDVPFVNYDQDGLKISATFSLSDYNQRNSANSVETAVPVMNPQEVEIANMSQADISKLLPGGLFTETKAYSSKDLPIKTGRQTYAVTGITTPDGKVTACDSSSVSLPDVCHKPFYSYDNMAYGTDGYKSAVPCSVEHPSSSRRPVTDLLWSYPPQERCFCDTNIPSFPVLSYGDQFPFYGSVISPRQRAHSSIENENVFTRNISHYSNSATDGNDIDHEVSYNRFTQKSNECTSSDGGLDLHKTPSMRFSDFQVGVRQSFNRFSHEASHSRVRCSDGEISSQNENVGTSHVLFAGDEDGILRDMRCRGMPSSLRIRYTSDLSNHRREGRPTFAMGKNLSRENSCNLSVSGPDQTHQPNSAIEFIQGPIPSTPNDQLPQRMTLPIGAPWPEVVAPCLVGMDATDMTGALQSVFFKSDVGKKHMESKARLPNYYTPRMKNKAKVKIHSEGEDERTDLTKTEEPNETARGLRNSPSCVDEMDVLPFIVSSELRAEPENSQRMTNHSTVGFATEPMKISQFPRHRGNHEDPKQPSSFISDQESLVTERRVRMKRDRVSSRHVVHPDGGSRKQNRKERSNLERRTLERKISMDSLSTEKEQPENNERLFSSDDSDISNALQTNFFLPLTSATEAPSAKKSSTTGSAPSAVGNEDYDKSYIPVEETIRSGSTSIRKRAKKIHKCGICGKTFTRKNTLNSHSHIHSGERPYSCDQCSRTFRQQGNLNRHKLTHSGIKSHICCYCNKAFSRASNLKIHQRIHSNYKPFKCDFCGKSFYQKTDMKIHRYTHTGEKPHVCTKCGKGFKQLTHLQNHLRIHSDIRMYKCEYCAKGFNQKGNLQAHIRGHTGERPHKCDICGKGFTLASTLNTHKRTHAATKPFQCEFCSKAYYHKNTLKTHYISTHPYTSGYCATMTEVHLTAA